MVSKSDNVLSIMEEWVKGDINHAEANRQLNEVYVKCVACGNDVVNVVYIKDEPYCPTCAINFYNTTKWENHTGKYNHMRGGF